MELHVDSLKAAASLDELMDRVTAGIDTVIIQRGGQPLVRLVPASAIPTPVPTSPTGTMADLIEILRTWESMDDGWAEGVEEAVRLGNLPMKLEDPWDR